MPTGFPPLRWSNPELRKLAYFVILTTAVNIVVASQLSYGAVNYMDSVHFLRPDLPHRDAARVHRLSAIAAFARGVRQMPHRSRRFLVRAQQAVRRGAGVCCDIPHLPAADPDAGAQLCARRGKPAKPVTGRRNTARTACASFQVCRRRRPTPCTKTVLLMKIGGGNNGIGIHGTHLGPGVTHPLRPLRRSPPEHSLGGIRQPAAPRRFTPPTTPSPTAPA